MSFSQNSLKKLKNFILLALIFSLSACSSSTENTNLPKDSTSPSSAESTSSPSFFTINENDPASVTIPGVSDLKEINLQTASKNSIAGFFDSVNGSVEINHKVSKSTPVILSGWAVLSTKDKPADMVIITYGDNNSLVAVFPINLDRPDVGKFLKNPTYNKSGWKGTFDPSIFPAGKVALKAWAYDSSSKKAIQLDKIHEVVVSDS